MIRTKMDCENVPAKSQSKKKDRKIIIQNGGIKMKKIIVTLVLVVGIVVALSAFEGMREHRGEESGQHQGKQHGMMNKNMGKSLKMLMEKLELTDAQKDQIDEMQSKSRKEMIQLEADIEILIVDKRTFMKDHDFGKVKKVVGNIMDLKKEMALKQIDDHAEIWNSLTPKQQEKAEELKEDKSGFQKKFKHDKKGHKKGKQNNK